MSPLNSTDDLFRAALGSHQAGRLAPAVEQYRELLRAAPGHLLARHYLGVALHQLGDPAAALPLLEETAQRQPDNPGFLVNLGNALKDLGRLDQARECYQQALRVSPGHAFAAFNLGQVNEQQGDLPAARCAYELASALPPARERRAVLSMVDAPQAALALMDGESLAGEPRQALLRRLWAGAVAVHAHAGEHAQFCLALAGLAQEGGAAALINAALDLVRGDRKPEAEETFRLALAHEPTNPRAATGVAVICNESGRPGAAHAVLADAIAKGVDHPLVWEAAADAHKGLGNLGAAAVAMERVLALAPGDLAVASSLNLLGLCRDDLSGDDLFRQALAYGARVRAAAPPRPGTLPTVAPRMARGAIGRLRVGLLSPDLGVHPVGKFMAGFFRHYPRDRLDLIVFNDRPVAPDSLSSAMRQDVAQVVDCHGWSDERLAQAVIEARLDVLLDLAGHTPGNRLPMMAWQLAPRQGSFLGYAGTTGSPAVDFRIADEHTEPLGAEAKSSERLIRMPGSYFCYTPGIPVPRVDDGASGGAGRVTFGCFVQRVKVTAETLRHWLSVLDAVAGAHMLVRCRSFADDLAVVEMQRLIGELGGDPKRFSLLPWGAADNYLELYRGIDIGLNTFPFHQATNLCDALWMGVPTLSVTGCEHRARMADSITAAAGVAGLCVTDTAALVAAASALAGDLAGLAEWRSRLRRDIPRSSLADGQGFALRLSDALVSAAG